MLRRCYEYCRLCSGLMLGALSFVWRRVLFRTTFIAVTGSVGKTTAKDCLVGILSSCFPTNATRGTSNGRFGIATTILRTRHRHRFAVVEMGTRRPGALRRGAWQVNPDLAVVLSVARTHINHFPTLEHTAAEKARVLSRLGRNGVAVLNADDARVLAMAERLRCRVTTFGRLPGCDLRATDVSARWPLRLAFRVHTPAESHWVRTNFVGEHWLSSVLAALAAAVSCEISLADAVAAIERVEPHRGRMQPVTLPSGAVMIRDDANGSVTALDKALRVLVEADVSRRIAVLGDSWDTGLGDPRERFEDLGRRAAPAVDMTVFLGEYAHHAATSAISCGVESESVRGFTDLSEAADYLKSELRQGDLVLLKGQYMLHLSRLCFSQLGEVACWKTRCPKVIMCDECEELHPVQCSGATVPASGRRPPRSTP